MSGKFGEIIDKAKQTRKPDIRNDEVTPDPEKMVNLCVKIPQYLRQHWAAEAKRQGITMTEIIIEALNQKFGKPDNQI